MPELSLKAWRVRVNVSALDDEDRRRLLDRVKGKFGFTEACRALGGGSGYTTLGRSSRAT